MSLLSLFTRKKPSEDDKAPALDPVPANPEPTLPLHRRAADAPPVSARRGERTARRELLFTIVRECMNRAGVLSATYKFKVLSLDSRGREFLVMVDLPGAQLRSGERLAEIEATIAQAAKAQHDIGIRAVYWRQNDHVAVGLPATGEATKAAAAPSKATEVPVPVPVPVQGTLAGYEPIAADEVAAFRQALATGSRPPRQPRPEQNVALLTGFENTEIHDERPPQLSTSQYGELR